MADELIPTVDPNIWIEERREGYVRYRNNNGRRWEVHGICDQRGDCLLGALIPGYGEIGSHSDLKRAKKILGKNRIDSELDVPVTPEFDICCASDGTLRIVELPENGD